MAQGVLDTDTHITGYRRVCAI